MTVTLNKITKVRFTQSILIAGHSPSETKEVEITDKISVERDSLGVMFIWQEKDPTDFHKDVSNNLVCKTWVPIQLVLQIIFEKQKPEPQFEAEPKKQFVSSMIEELPEVKKTTKSKKDKKVN
jgi:hypothetical protein